MLQLARAQVLEVVEQRPQIQFLQVKLLEQGRVEQAYFLTGKDSKCSVGDYVLVNCTAVSLKLGTGGYHIVVSKVSAEDNLDYVPNQWGHIMKLRYTPLQLAVDAVEEQSSPYHSQFLDETAHLKHTPVIIGELHSMLPMVALSLHHDHPSCKLVYVMPDGASLPIALSRHVHDLKQMGILSSTVTVGHAWGGDLEAVNIYTGLLAAKEVAEADLILCMLGPGVVGTGTPFGFSGVQLAEVIHAVTILGGTPICIPRIQFADSRPAHVGISHHTLTLLQRLILTSVLLPVPLFGDWRDPYLQSQLMNQKNAASVYPLVVPAPTIPTLEQLQRKYPEPITTMGRDIYQDASLFQTSYVAAQVASRIHSYLNEHAIVGQPVQSVLETLAKLWDVE